MEGPSSGPPSNSIADSEDDDAVLANSEFLTRQEVLRRRSRRLSRLAKCYKDHYWSLMEDLKRKHREYYWKYGVSPFRDEDETEHRENGAVSNNNNDDDIKNSNHHQNHKVNGDVVSSSSGKLGLGFGGGSFIQCAFRGCGTKAMALSTYCHSHILSDTKQKLYKDCKYVLKSTGAGPILCAKPILVSSVPSLCPIHLQKAEKTLKGLLRKEGAPVASSNKLASKFHLVITEYVNLIQSRRRAAGGVNRDNITIKDGAT